MEIVNLCSSPVVVNRSDRVTSEVSFAFAVVVAKLFVRLSDVDRRRSFDLAGAVTFATLALGDVGTVAVGLAFAGAFRFTFALGDVDTFALGLAFAGAFRRTCALGDVGTFAFCLAFAVAFRRTLALGSLTRCSTTTLSK